MYMCILFILFLIITILIHIFNEYRPKSRQLNPLAKCFTPKLKYFELSPDALIFKPLLQQSMSYTSLNPNAPPFSLFLEAKQNHDLDFSNNSPSVIEVDTPNISLEISSETIEFDYTTSSISLSMYDPTPSSDNCALSSRKFYIFVFFCVMLTLLIFVNLTSGMINCDQDSPQVILQNLRLKI